MANVGMTDPGYDAAAITPSDTDPTGNVRALYVGGAGDLKVQTIAGNDVTFADIVAGSIIPIRCKRVYSTGTSATNIVAFY